MFIFSFFIIYVSQLTLLFSTAKQLLNLMQTETNPPRRFQLISFSLYSMDRFTSFALLLFRFTKRWNCPFRQCRYPGPNNVLRVSGAPNRACRHRTQEQLEPPVKKSAHKPRVGRRR